MALIEETKKIAKLVKLNLNDDELNRLAGMLSETLKYIDVLSELDEHGVQETFQVTGLQNVFQTDGTSGALAQNEALSNAPVKTKNLFETKGVFDR